MSDIARKLCLHGANSENFKIGCEEIDKARHPMMRGPENDCSHHTHPDHAAVDGTFAVLSMQCCRRRKYVRAGNAGSSVYALLRSRVQFAAVSSPAKLLLLDQPDADPCRHSGQ